MGHLLEIPPPLLKSLLLLLYFYFMFYMSNIHVRLAHTAYVAYYILFIRNKKKRTRKVIVFFTKLNGQRISGKNFLILETRVTQGKRSFLLGKTEERRKERDISDIRVTKLSDPFQVTK